LWAIARIDFGLSEEDTGYLTSAMFDALGKQKRIAERQEWIRTGIVAAAVINFSMCHPDKPVAATEFVPDYGEKKAFNLMEMTPEEQTAYVKAEASKKTYTRRS
jgi:hypothetical protein